MSMERIGENERESVVIELPLRISLADLDRLNDAAARASKADTSEGPKASSDEVQRARAEAGKLLKVRRRRERLLGSQLFGDPAWDILLDLFIQRLDGRAATVTSACIGSGAPQTTALRYLTSLIEHGIVVRRASLDDRRVQYVELSAVGFERMIGILNEAADP